MNMARQFEMWAKVWPKPWTAQWRPQHLDGHLPLGGGGDELLTQTFLLTENPATENLANADEEISSNRGS